MMSAAALATLLALVFLIALGGSAILRRVLGRSAVLDRPNARSSHTVPTPRGAGIAVIAAIALGWSVLAAIEQRPPTELIVLAGALALAALSFRDDLAPLPAWLRLMGHAAAVVLGLLALPEDGLVFQGILLPLADRAATAFLWLWFVNLFNFMDGIDGITGVETIAIGIGLAVLAAMHGPLGGTGALALIAAAAALGFLCLNWHPARIFLGDVGSVPLGFILGWLLLSAAASGQWAAALILPLYYLADASLTLARRILRREHFWQAHRQHFYQQAVGRGLSHASVALRIAALNAGLIGLALAAPRYPALALAGAALAVALLLRHFGRAAPAG